MGKRIISIICSIGVFLLIAIFPEVMPAWSAPGDKKQIRQESPDKSVLDLEDTKPGEKSEKSVKKKVVKKAGAAAGVGVVGKKATSEVKKRLK